MKKTKSAAIVLAAGRGRRMKTGKAKQFLEICQKPVLYYPLKAFEESAVDDVVLVTGKDDIEFCKDEIVGKYGFSKVRSIVSGGKERYNSVYAGLCELAGGTVDLTTPDIVLIHDGARALITAELINELTEETARYKACVTGTPLKDTVKVVDDELMTVDTPNRSRLWSVQTPQAFDFKLIYEAYKKLAEKETELEKDGIKITDDAMVLELMSGIKTKLVMGSYLNMKLTTPEDILIFESILSRAEG
ncbi:MAG: 2-C-methyl-D-erythritol 4-phosphate cytidylyltransferase [Lachnospiraceae bacterium]|nr:2-C-methyl-D-erythritol 4-phosphate cytidylyltransferase [Lachnospiraceae bacterium]